MKNLFSFVTSVRSSFADLQPRDFFPTYLTLVLKQPIKVISARITHLKVKKTVTSIEQRAL